MGTWEFPGHISAANFESIKNSYSMISEKGPYTHILSIPEDLSLEPLSMIDILVQKQ